MKDNPFVFDLYRFLRRFGLLIYTGDREADWQMIEDEIRELRLQRVIDDEEFRQAMAALRREKDRA